MRTRYDGTMERSDDELRAWAEGFLAGRGISVRGEQFAPLSRVYEVLWNTSNVSHATKQQLIDLLMEKYGKRQQVDMWNLAWDICSLLKRRVRLKSQREGKLLRDALGDRQKLRVSERWELQ